METTQVDLTMFCADEEGRYSIRVPWVASGYRYATDGAWCARVATTDPDTRRDDGAAYPDMTCLGWERCAEAIDPIPPHDGETRREVCPQEYHEDCPSCAGSGDCECEECGAEHECGRCSGTGIVPGSGAHPATCACGGTRYVAVPGPQRIGAASYPGNRILALSALPGIRVSCPTDDEDKLYFVADGGIEGVMAARRADAP